MPKRNNAFCIKPWTQACIRTNGDITLCCQSLEKSNFNLKTSTIDAWWNSEFVSTTRTQMLNKTIPPACMSCAAEEQQGSISLRQKSNKEYKIFEQYAEQTLSHFRYPMLSPIEMEIQLTNLCNLKCLMCAEEASSALLSENMRLRINISKPDDYTLSDSDFNKIQAWIATKPKSINFRGGEPLVVPEIKRLLQWGVEQELLADTVIHISTNATKLDNEWMSILTSIKQLRIMVSIDAIGQLNDYIRFGSKWDIINTNVAKLSRIPGINLVVHATIQNLNILSIGNLITWCELNSYFFDFTILSEPTIFKLTNLPSNLLSDAMHNLRELSDTAGNGAHLADIVEHAIQSSDSQWDNFKNEINMRDQARNTSILDIIPQFREYWHAKN
jgi:hypothetical protein